MVPWKIVQNSFSFKKDSSLKSKFLSSCCAKPVGPLWNTVGEFWENMSVIIFVVMKVKRTVAVKREMSLKWPIRLVLYSIFWSHMIAHVRNRPKQIEFYCFSHKTIVWLKEHFILWIRSSILNLKANSLSLRAKVWLIHFSEFISVATRRWSHGFGRTWGWECDNVFLGEPFL